MTQASTLVLSQADAPATMSEPAADAVGVEPTEAMGMDAAPAPMADTAADHTVAETHTEKKAGLPQLDPAHFPSQVFWLAIVFVTLYVLVARWALPRIQTVLAMREETLKTNLDRAQHAQQQAEAARDTYEKTQAEARAHAQQLIDAVQTRVKEVSAQTKADMEAALTANIQTVEAQLRKSKQEAMQNVAQAANDLTVAVIEKVTGTKPESAQVERSVAALLKA